MTDITCPCCGHPMLLPFQNGAGHTCYMVGCDGCGFGGETVRVELEDAQLDAKRLVRAELARLTQEFVLHGRWLMTLEAADGTRYEVECPYDIGLAQECVMRNHQWRAEHPLRLPGEPE